MEATLKGNSCYYDPFQLYWLQYVMNILGPGNMEATFKGNTNIQLLQLKWLLYVLTILGTEIWKPPLKKIPKYQLYWLLYAQNRLGSKIWKLLLKETSLTLAFFSCNVYNM